MLTNEHSWAGRQVGAVTFSDQEVEEFREVFELVDVDKGGTIEADEVGGRGNPAAAWISIPPFVSNLLSGPQPAGDGFDGAARYRNQQRAG